MTSPPLSNAPGLPAIRYRIGTFTSFRQAMLDAIALPDLMATSVTTLQKPVGSGDTTITIVDGNQFPISPNFRIKIGNEYLQVVDRTDPLTWTVVRSPSPAAYSTGDIVLLSPPNPFASWRPDSAGDYQTMFVELWAYLADILTFYQERIANEAYLGTAALRDSLLRLVTLIDYHPNPGSGASGVVAFTAAKNRSLTVPAGFRVGSKPSPGKAAVVFETASALSVVGDNSVIALSLLSPDVPFPPNTIVFQGVTNRLAVGDYLLAVQNQETPAEAVHLLLISSVTTSKGANTTTINWQEEIGGGSYKQAGKQDSIYAFRVTGAPFGANAPQWNTLSPTLTNSDGKGTNPNAPYPVNWETDSFLNLDIEASILDRLNAVTVPALAIQQPGIVESFRFRSANPWFYIPAVGDHQNVLFLDSVYKQLNYTLQNQGWAVLLTDGNIFQILHVTDARQSTTVAYTLSSKVTRLTFAEEMFKNAFPIRNTVVMTGGELLPLQIDLPLPLQTSSDSQLILQGVDTQLQPGQTILISGNLFDPVTGTASSTSAAESSVIDGSPVPNPANNVTVVNLKNPLSKQYMRATVTVMANSVEVTQGETVKDEVLGSSNGGAFQSFALKKSPLTYLPSADPEGLSAVESTLTVIVNGVAWTEQPNLAESAPDSQDYTTTLDDSSQTTVMFGDGFNGAMPPSGTSNIHARYRKGLGSSGNVPSGTIQQLIDSVPDLQRVTNPLPSGGARDADAPSQIRSAAPASLRTFGRAVSAPDYAALALNFPGISKASATWVVRDPVTLQAIAHPYVQLTVATSDQSPIQGTPLARKLRQFLDSHRDPNVPLRLQDSNLVFIEVSVEVRIDGRHPQQATLGQVQAALNPARNPDGTLGYFAFESLQFGQTIFLSNVYAVVQNVPGVQSATITELRRVGPGVAEPAGAPHDVVVGPTEIATIAPPGTGQGQLTVTGQGGFLDR